MEDADALGREAFVGVALASLVSGLDRASEMLSKCQYLMPSISVTTGSLFHPQTVGPSGQRTVDIKFSHLQCFCTTRLRSQMPFVNFDKLLDCGQHPSKNTQSKAHLV